MKSLKILASVAVLTTLTACGDSNVKTVKNYTFDFNKSMNVGTAIDGTPQCKKVQWKDESTKEQKFVSATCTFTDEELKKDFEAETKHFQQVKEKVDKDTERALKDIEKKYKPLMGENSPQFDKDKIIAATQKICKKVDDKVECDTEILRKEFNLKENHGWHDLKYIDSDLTHLFRNANPEKEICANYFVKIECTEPPKMAQSMEAKITFVINTDNSVNVSKGEFLKDGKIIQTLENKYQERGNRAILEPFYERK